MTPFAEVLGDASPAAFAAGLLRKVFDEGFEATLWTKLRTLKESGWAPDKFSLRRFEYLALAARLFDESGSRSVDEFLEYARSYTTREPDTRNAVQVMTIHKSKGLTFDCVILPDVEGSSLASVRRNLGVKRDEHRQVEWVLDLPSKEIVLGDEVLSSYRADCEAEAAYENLCKFYVALTRARQANYVIAQPRATTARSNNFVKLLEAALADEADPDTTTFGGREARVLYASETPSTNARWFENHERSTEGSEDERISAGVEDPGRRRPLRRTPSGSESSVVSARQLFSRGGRFARSFGTLVHALFEEIDWLDTMSEDRLASAWANVPCPDDSLRKRAVDEVRGALAAPAVRESLGKPSPDATCWREKRFEILLNGEWLSGTFDRVVIESDRATILDFKTDAPESEEALEARVDGYRPQLQTYRQVLSRMTGLPEKVIGCQLLFTRLKRVIDVE
jgi:ATP-dependent exoDNAse (exonuclease V) beta subunit